MPKAIIPCDHSDHRYETDPMDENRSPYCPGAGAYGGSYDRFVEGHTGAVVVELTRHVVWNCGEDTDDHEPECYPETQWWQTPYEPVEVSDDE